MQPGPDFKPLRGKKVVLRARDEKLLSDYYEKRFREEVLRWADTFPEKQTYAEVYRRFENQERSPCEFRLWIFTTADKLIGEVSVFDINRDRNTAEFGIVIFEPSYWGQGYGTEAARLFLANVCQRFNLKSIYLSTLQDNKRAIRSFEKLGFRTTERVASEGERMVKMEAAAAQFSTSG